MKKALIFAAVTLAFTTGSAFAGGDGCHHKDAMADAQGQENQLPINANMDEVTDPKLLALLKKQKEEEEKLQLGVVVHN